MASVEELLVVRYVDRRDSDWNEPEDVSLAKHALYEVMRAQVEPGLRAVRGHLNEAVEASSRLGVASLLTIELAYDALQLAQDLIYQADQAIREWVLDTNEMTFDELVAVSDRILRGTP